MRQLTLATGTFETHRKPTRREKFLSNMEKVVPWRDLCAVIAPYYPKGENGRSPVGLERMLRIYFLQQWFNLSDPGAEEALYESVVSGNDKCPLIGRYFCPSTRVNDHVNPRLFGTKTRIVGYRGA